MICESSPTSSQVNNGQSDWNKWFAPFFDFIKDNSEAKAFVYINWDWTQTPQWPTWGDCRIETNTTIKNNWVNEVSNSMYQHAGWSPNAITLNCDNDVWYRIENDGRDWWLQASGGNNGTYTANQNSTGDFTQWKKVSAGGDWFYLENRGNDQRLKDGPTMVAASNSGNNVQWQEVDAGNGYQRLQNRASGQWLQASGSNNGAYMTSTNSTGIWTKWKFVTVSSNARVATHQSDRLEAEQYAGNAVRAYPNPASSYLTIQLSAADESAPVVLKDMQGRTLVQQQLKSNESLGTSTLSAGLYLVEVHAATYTETRKILINR